MDLPCHSCGEMFPIEELSIVLGSSLVCPSCLVLINNSDEMKQINKTSHSQNNKRELTIGEKIPK